MHDALDDDAFERLPPCAQQDMLATLRLDNMVTTLPQPPDWVEKDLLAHMSAYKPYYGGSDGSSEDFEELPTPGTSENGDLTESDYYDEDMFDEGDVSDIDSGEEDVECETETVEATAIPCLSRSNLCFHQ